MAAVTLAVMALAASVATTPEVGAAAPAPERVGQPPAAGDAVRLGPLAGTSRMHIEVVLEPRSQAALTRFATAVSTPGNPLYGHYLARGQFATRFGPTAAAIAAVERSLTSDGLSIGPIAADHLSIPISATASHIATAFSISFSRYRTPDGRIAYANTEAPMFPGDVARYLVGVIGLDSLNLARPLGLQRLLTHAEGTVTPEEITGGPEPCATAVHARRENSAFTANQLASTYRFAPLYRQHDEGAGVTVALFELEPNRRSDIAAYQACYGTSTTVTYTKIDGGAGSGPGVGEAALDIEDVIGLAPDVAIHVYQAPNSGTGAFDDYQAIVDDDTAQVVSTSWGACEAQTGSSAINAESTLFKQAATQGQSVFASAGDNGSEDCSTHTVSVEDPASQPYVTGVGGTEITQLGQPPTEIVWNERTTGSGAGGGGVSSSHKMPSYQSAAPASLHVINVESSGSQCKAASGSFCRQVPDVSADADPFSGYLIYFDGFWTGIGGTSAAAPLWAAFMALTDASRACAGSSVGFANPALYGVAGSTYAADFNDITSGNNDYTGASGGLYEAGVGYDMASGLGTPNGINLSRTLCASLPSS